MLSLKCMKRKAVTPFLSCRWSLFAISLTTTPLSILGSKETRFTWNNYQEKEDEIVSRIDRCLANQGWRLAFEEAVIFHETIIGSDHAPLRLDLHYKQHTYAPPPPPLFDMMKDGIQIPYQTKLLVICGTWEQQRK
ncbi:hypothetical protein LINPERPRIM_LOCUS20987 [Linum perenne]